VVLISSPVELELAAAGAITIVADLVDLGLESDVGYSALAQPAVMLLATLAAKHQAHAWFAGSGAVAMAIAVHDRFFAPGSTVRRPAARPYSARPTPTRSSALLVG
jgi:hypothetical protein